MSSEDSPNARVREIAKKTVVVLNGVIRFEFVRKSLVRHYVRPIAVDAHSEVVRSFENEELRVFRQHRRISDAFQQIHVEPRTEDCWRWIQISQELLRGSVNCCWRRLIGCWRSM